MLERKWNQDNMNFNQIISELTECHVTGSKPIQLCIEIHYAIYLFTLMNFHCIDS